MDIKMIATVACFLCMASGSVFGAATNHTNVLDVLMTRGRVACSTNTLERSVTVKRTTTVRFFLHEAECGSAGSSFAEINSKFEEDFTNQMRQRHPDAYAVAMRSDGNPHNPALTACWRNMEDCVRTTGVWKDVVAQVRKRGAAQVEFCPPEKFYFDAREVKNRRFHLPGWAFRFSEQVEER